MTPSAVVVSHFARCRVNTAKKTQEVEAGKAKVACVAAPLALQGFRCPYNLQFTTQHSSEYAMLTGPAREQTAAVAGRVGEPAVLLAARRQESREAGNLPSLPLPALYPVPTEPD